MSTPGPVRETPSVAQLRELAARYLPDSVRFAVGTFTRVPVPPPAVVNPTTTGRGLVWAPVVGACLGLVSAIPLMITGVDLLARLLSATLVVALAAWLTRGLHWDGLADLADGLGSGAPPARARDIMSRSDIGPFGVLVMVLVLLLQIVALAHLPADGPAVAGWVLAMSLGRLAVVAACGPWGRPARADGLGALVVGSVTVPGIAAAGGVGLAVAVAGAALGPLPWVSAVLWCPAAALATGAAVTLIARRRIGGLTGDVLGAIVELATVAVLLTLALR